MSGEQGEIVGEKKEGRASARGITVGETGIEGEAILALRHLKECAIEKAGEIVITDRDHLHLHEILIVDETLLLAPARVLDLTPLLPTKRRLPPVGPALRRLLASPRKLKELRLHHLSLKFKRTMQNTKM
jgi:hypothetical protein